MPLDHDAQVIADGAATLYALDPSLSGAAMRLLLAQAWAESYMGRGNLQGRNWLGAFMSGSNNWGSMQAGDAWRAQHAGDAGYGAIPYTDTHADGTKYRAFLRVYPTQRDGAGAFLALVRADFGPDGIPEDSTTYASKLRGKGYYEAPLSQYVKMLDGSAATVDAALARASAAGYVGSPDVERPEGVPPGAVMFGGGGGGTAGALGGVVVAVILALVYFARTRL